MSVYRKPEAVIQVISIGVLVVILLFILFFATIVTLMSDDLYVILFERLRFGFYLKAVAALLGSSLLSMPFVYGSIRFRYNHLNRDAKIIDFFYVFKRPILLCKVVLLKMIIWFTRGMYQLLALLIGVIAETIFYSLTLLLKGEEVWKLSLGDLSSVISDKMERNILFAAYVLVWFCVILILIVVHIKFMFCRYSLFFYEELSAIEAVHVGRLAIRGRFLKICFDLIQNYAYYFLMVLSFGMLKGFLKKYKKEPFVLLARRWVEQGRALYFGKKGRKTLDKSY